MHGECLKLVITRRGFSVIGCVGGVVRLSLCSVVCAPTGVETLTKQEDKTKGGVYACAADGT